MPLFGWLYFRFGYATVATASSPMPFEKKLAHMALEARVQQEAPKDSPLQPSDDNYQAGVNVYRANCAMCHGLPGQAQSPTSKGMYPRPPQLFKGHGVTDDPVGETYWKVANGIRLTGMPAYTSSLSQTRLRCRICSLRLRPREMLGNRPCSTNGRTCSKSINGSV